VLLARGRLDGGDDLPRDAQLGERAERRHLGWAEIPDGLIKTDHALLNDILPVRANKKVRARLRSYKIFIFVEEIFESVAVVVACQLCNGFIG